MLAKCNYNSKRQGQNVRSYKNHRTNSHLTWLPRIWDDSLRLFLCMCLHAWVFLYVDVGGWPSRCIAHVYCRWLGWKGHDDNECWQKHPHATTCTTCFFFVFFHMWHPPVWGCCNIHDYSQCHWWLTVVCPYFYLLVLNAAVSQEVCTCHPNDALHHQEHIIEVGSYFLTVDQLAVSSSLREDS